MYKSTLITQNPTIMGGKACIREMRVTVSMILGQLASGRTVRDILADYPYLEKEDILHAFMTPFPAISGIRKTGASCGTAEASPCALAMERQRWWAPSRYCRRKLHATYSAAALLPAKRKGTR